MNNSLLNKKAGVECETVTIGTAEDGSYSDAKTVVKEGNNVRITDVRVFSISNLINLSRQHRK